jgi:hypothetical protein
MNLCSDGHDEVCYSERRCPACELAKEKDAEIKKLERTNDEQLDTIFELERRVKELEENQA